MVGLGRLNHVAIAVPDMEAATKLYRDVLGAKVSDAFPQVDHGVTTVFIDLGIHLLIFNLLSSILPFSLFYLVNNGLFTQFFFQSNIFPMKFYYYFYRYYQFIIITILLLLLGNTKIELLHPLGEKSPIQNFLNKNPSGGVHHICIEVDDIHSAVKTVADKGIKVIDPVPKIGAHGKPVVFLHPKSLNGVLVELEQK